MRKTKGITLVALIITIIIMLILIAVTVSLVVNSNLLGRAKNAGDEWEAAQIRDNNEVGNFEAQIADWEASLCNHDWGQWNVTTFASCSATGEKTRRCNNCGATQTETIPVTAHVFTNGTGNCIYNCGTTQSSLVIGAYLVGYNPTVGPNNEIISTSYTSVGSININIPGEYGDGTHGNGFSNQTFDLASYEWYPEEEGAMKWRVLGEEDGHIIITTADPIQTNASPKANMYFRGMAGYVNCIEELDKISSIYGQGKYADTSKYKLTQDTIENNVVTGNTTSSNNLSGARSIKLEDLQSAGHLDTISSDSRSYTKNASTGYIIEDDNAETPVDSSYSTFKYWDEYVGGTKTLKVLTCPDSSTNASVTIVDPQHSVTYVTGYNTAKYKVTPAYKMIAKWSDGVTNASYWLASHYVYFGQGYVRYRAYCESTADVASVDLSKSSGGPTNGGRAVRPVVYLQSNINLSYDSTTQTYSIVAGD